MLSTKKAIAWLKEFPFMYDFVRHQLYSRIQSFNRRKIFSKVYRDNLWDGKESFSGIGSSLEATEALRIALPQIITELKIRSLLDIPCGDYHWMRSVSLGVERYVGADIVRPLVEQNARLYSGQGKFICLDLLKDTLPKVDAVFCRDCLPHLSLREVHKALHNISKAKPIYLLTTTYPDCVENMDTVAPYYRPLNFEIAPFNLPAPLVIARDFTTGHNSKDYKYLAAWKMADLDI